MHKMSVQNHITESIPEASVCQAKDRHVTDTVLFKPKVDSSLLNCVSDPPETPAVHNGNSNVHTSILLEPSEYFFDDEFSVPFDANLRDEVGSTHRGLTEESDEGISSSGATHRGVCLAVVGHSRSDSCLFSPLDSGDSGQSGLGPNTNDPRIESPADKLYTKPSPTTYPQKKVCRPDSTSAPSSSRHHLISADLSAILSDTGEADEPGNPLDGREFVFSPANPVFISHPTSVTSSWMQAVMEGSCNRELKELLRRTAEALNYKLAWDDVQGALIDGNDQNNLPSTSSPRTSCLQRSTSHGNLWSTASLVGMRQTLAHISANISKNEKTENPSVAKQIRSVGVATTDSMCTMTQDNSAPDTTTAIAVGTTTWARVRSSRESLNSRKQMSFADDVEPTECSTIRKPTCTVPLPQSTVAWRAIKMAAGNEMTTWGQLKRTASLATRQANNKAPDVEHNAHTSLMSDWNERPLEKTELHNFLRSRSHRSPVCKKVMHRYSGTLLEIFMRARAQDTITNSLVSSTRPCLLKQLGPTIANTSLPRPKRTFSARSLQVSASLSPSQTDGDGDEAPINSTSPNTRPPLNRPIASNPRVWFHGLLTTDGISTFSNTSQETGPAATHKQGLAFAPGSIPPPKPSSQPPVVPCRRSSMLAQFPCRRSTGRLAVRDLRRVGQPVMGPGGGDVSSFALLTMSADPDSECMSRLRENDSPVYIKNPRSAIAYPGLGLLAVPKPSRIESATFLSQTLPDLSVLSQAAAEEARSGTPTMCRREVVEEEGHIGCSNSRVRGRAASAAASRRIQPATLYKEGQWSRNPSAHLQSSDNVPVRLTEQETRSRIPHLGTYDKSTAVTRHKFPNADRSTSVPDVSTNSDAGQPTDLLMTASLTAQETAIDAETGADPSHTFVLERENLRSKKSVSFSGNMHALGPLRRMPCTVTVSPTRTVAPLRYHSPDARVIPRHWGLYGQDPPPLAEFKPFDIADHNDVSSSTRPSDVDIRYHAMVMDVIRAVQETVAYFCQPVATSCVSDATLASSSTGGNRGSSSLTTPGRSSLLAVIFPLMTLLSDGLLPPARPLFTKPLRTRIWLLVEESCKQSAYLTGVAYHTLNNALSQVKALPGAPSEKARFKAFVCVCLNNRALPMWLNCMVSNEPLLKRFYCEGAFIRQCRSTLRGLYADLLTHVEQLLAFPFNFDITVEARRPLVGADHHSSSKHNSLSRNTGVAAATKNDRVVEKKAERPHQSDAMVRTNARSDAPKPTCSRALSATPVCATKTPSVSHLGLATSSAKTAAITGRTGQALAPKQSTSIETQASSSASSSAGANWRVPGPGKTAPMRGKLRTALSTFRRSTGQGDVGSFHVSAVSQSKVRSASSGIPVPSSETATSFPRTVRP